MIAARILDPGTRLATTRSWRNTTLAEDFGVADADEDDLYAALGWLLERHAAIQRKLAKRHPGENPLVLQDLSSSYFEGSACFLAGRGYIRDGNKGTQQVNYGLMTGSRGCPVGICVYAGNTADPQTFLPEVDRLKDDFGIEQLVMMADRSMIPRKSIDTLQEVAGLQWIAALKTGAICTSVPAADRVTSTCGTCRRASGLRG